MIDEDKFRLLHHNGFKAFIPTGSVGCGWKRDKREISFDEVVDIDVEALRELLTRWNAEDDYDAR